MGNYFRVSPLIYCAPILLLVIVDQPLLFIQAADDVNDCKGVVNCLKCDSTNTTRCSKCTQLVVLRSKTSCSESPCPPGYTKHWTSLVDYMTSVCKEGLTVGGVTGEAVGVTIGLLVCLVAALATALYCKVKQRRKPTPSLTYSSQGSDESECVEFVKQISELRGEAPVFLAMLNDTRRQVRSLRSHSALQPYKPVLKDLSRILILLNRSEERLGTPPADWETLLAWGQRVLNRYKKHHPNQVNELVSFLGGNGGSRIEQAQFNISVFDTNYNTRKSSREFSEWHSSQLDDFFTLGFRPQDEITTEL